MYAMTGALTPAATTFAEATAEAHSDCTRKMILDVRRHHSTSDMRRRAHPDTRTTMTAVVPVVAVVAAGVTAWSHHGMRMHIS